MSSHPSAIEKPAVWYESGEGVGTIWFDARGRSVNLLDEATVSGFAQALRQALGDERTRGVIVASAKSGFIAGADLTRIFARAEAPPTEDSYHVLLRRLETGGKPFVAALNGVALGGGFELALACHHRVAAADSSARVGFPEVTLGLLPGAGGTQRLPRLVGVEKAMPLLLEGRQLSFAEARDLGLIDELVERDRLLTAARDWLKSNPSATQPWDRGGYRVPGADVQSPKMRTYFANLIAQIRKRTWGVYPAPPAIAACVYEGLQLSIDAGLHVERRRFRELARTPEAKAMVRTLFFSLNRADKLSARPRDIPRSSFRKVGVLGAGMMGSGIALVCARAGFTVVLIDRDLETAERGKRDDRILATTDYSELSGADAVIEAVYEDRALKAEVTRRAESVIPERALLATNTSTLPITSLSAATTRPANFIGMHFFSPVERMRLVEVIRGRETSDRALAVALDFVQAIGKTPIVVNDRRGFFTSRVFKAYTREGIMLLKDGVAGALIENAGRLAGMAVGPLAVQDEVNMALACRIIEQMRADLGDEYVPQPGDDVFELFVRKLDRPGKSAGRGFYEYPSEGRKYLWPGLAEHFPPAARQPDVAEVKRRLLYAQSLEATRAFEEGVIDDPDAGDVASVLGWGFPASTGGVFSLIEQVGAAKFVAECDAFARRFGPRFEVPQSLRDVARHGTSLAESRRVAVSA